DGWRTVRDTRGIDLHAFDRECGGIRRVVAGADTSRVAHRHLDVTPVVGIRPRPGRRGCGARLGGLLPRGGGVVRRAVYRCGFGFSGGPAACEAEAAGGNRDGCGSYGRSHTWVSGRSQSSLLIHTNDGDHVCPAVLMYSQFTRGGEAPRGEAGGLR